MSIAFGVHDLLEYNEKYSVPICRECKYAIQKSALGSHLLRHKIYRRERQSLLASIAGLDILEPDDVRTPPTGSPPVDGLPVISGYRCTATGCESLCASFKRARHHWSERHGVSDPPDSFACSVNLQTFFRGTKLRYFEVTPPSSQAERPHATSGDLTLVVPPPPNKTISVLRPDPLCDSDLETLTYSHHFTTTTSLTLPTGTHDPLKYWQIDVVAQALQLDWLMCGLLAISASHLVTLSDNETNKQLHRERSARFLEKFTTKWLEMKRSPDMTEAKGAKAGAQIICIHRCCQWTSELPMVDQGIFSESTPFELQLYILIMTIRGCTDPDFALRCTIDSDEMNQEMIVHVASNLGGILVAEVSSNPAPALLERFRILPYRMAEVLEKPDSLPDFFATLSAIDALIKCCSLSYAPDEAGAVWTGMESWSRTLSDHFNQMVWRRSSAALIVLAHWSLLVKRAECHYWFLRGSATKILCQVVGEFPADSNAQSLVKSLMG